MRKVWGRLGVWLFWCAWPVLWLYLYRTTRSRVVIESEGAVLVVKNWLGDGTWALPGGGKHRREAGIEALIREVKEETGVELSADKLSPLGTYTYRDKGFRFQQELFGARFAKRPVLQSRPVEILETAWIPPVQLTSRNANPETLRAIAVWRAQGGFATI